MIKNNTLSFYGVMSNIDIFFFNLVTFACEDEDTRCPNWARIGECSANAGWMLKHCKKSCNQICEGGKFHYLFNGQK